jgi:hypothetical protein
VTGLAASTTTIVRGRRRHAVQCVERALEVARVSRERPQFIESAIDSFRIASNRSGIDTTLYPAGDMAQSLSMEEGPEPSVNSR